MRSDQLCRDGPPEAHICLPDPRVQLELLQYPHQHDFERVHGVPISDAVPKSATKRQIRVRMAFLDRFRPEPVRIEPLRIRSPEVFSPVQRVKVEADVLPRWDLETVQLDGFGVVPAYEGNHRTQSERLLEHHFCVLQLAERVRVDVGARAGKHLADLGDHLGLVLGVHGQEETRVGDREGGGVVALDDNRKKIC